MQKYRINRSWGREWNFLVSIMKHRTYAKQGNNILISTDYSAVMIMVQRTWLEIVWRSVLVPLQQFTVLASRIYSKVKKNRQHVYGIEEHTPCCHALKHGERTPLLKSS